MGITHLSRDWGSIPSIVRMVTTDNLAAITANGYLLTQASTIDSLNHGAFGWQDSDLVAIQYSGGEGMFTRNATTNAFVSQNPAPASSGPVLGPGFGFDPNFTLFNIAALPGYFGDTISDSQSQNATYSTATNLAANTILMPFMFAKQRTGVHMKTDIKTGAGASTITMGIYASVSDSTNTHYLEPTGAPLEAHSISTALSGTVTVNITQVFAANILYWAAMQASTAATLAIYCGKIAISALGGWTNAGSGQGGPWCLGLNNAYVAGTLPTIVPTDELIGNTLPTYAPVMYFEFSA